MYKRLDCICGGGIEFNSKAYFILVEPYLVFWNGIAFQLIIIYSKYFVFIVAYLPSGKNFPLCSYLNHSIIRIKFCPLLLEPFKFSKVLSMLSFSSQYASFVSLTANHIIYFYVFWTYTLSLAQFSLYGIKSCAGTAGSRTWFQELSWKAGVGVTPSLFAVEWSWNGTFDCFVNSVSAGKPVDWPCSLHFQSAWNCIFQLWKCLWVLALGRFVHWWNTGWFWQTKLSGLLYLVMQPLNPATWMTSFSFNAIQKSLGHMTPIIRIFLYFYCKTFGVVLNILIEYF